MTSSTCDLDVDPSTCTDTALIRATHVALVRGKAERRQVPGYAVGFTLPEPITMSWSIWSGIVELACDSNFSAEGELWTSDRAALVREYEAAMARLAELESAAQN